MRKIILLLFVLAFFNASSQESDFKRLNFGIQTNADLFPGVRIIPETGSEIFESHTSLIYSLGLSFKLHFKKDLNSKFIINMLFEKRQITRSIIPDYDELTRYIENNNLWTESFNAYNYGLGGGLDLVGDPSFQLEFKYRKYLNLYKERFIYLDLGFGIINYVIGSHGSYYDWTYIDENNKLIWDAYAKTEIYSNPTRDFNYSAIFGIGHTFATKIVDFDMNLSAYFYKPNFYGKYKTNPFTDKISATGQFIEKPFMFRYSVTFYLNRKNKNK